MPRPVRIPRSAFAKSPRKPKASIRSRGRRFTSGFADTASSKREGRWWQTQLPIRWGSTAHAMTRSRHARYRCARRPIHRRRSASVLFTLPEDDFGVVNKQMQAGTLAVVASSRADNKALGQGRLLLINNEIDQTTGTIQLKATFPNKNHALWPGQFVDVQLLVETRHNAITAPSAADSTLRTLPRPSTPARRPHPLHRRITVLLPHPGNPPLRALRRLTWRAHQRARRHHGRRRGSRGRGRGRYRQATARPASERADRVPDAGAAGGRGEQPAGCVDGAPAQPLPRHLRAHGHRQLPRSVGPWLCRMAPSTGWAA